MKRRGIRGDVAFDRHKTRDGDFPVRPFFPKKHHPRAARPFVVVLKIYSFNIFRIDESRGWRGLQRALREGFRVMKGGIPGRKRRNQANQGRDSG